MLRLVFLSLLLCSPCIAAGDSAEANCDPASGASCVNEGQDYQSMLQARVGVDAQESGAEDDKKKDNDADDDDKEAKWFCVVAGNSVQGPFSTVDAAKTELSKISSGSRMVCEMTSNGAKSDPHTVGGQNQGGGAASGFNKWWGGWSDIHNMNAKCNANNACKNNQATTGGPVAAFSMTSKYSCTRSDYSGHFWLYRDDIAASFGTGTNRAGMLGKQFWVSKPDGTDVKGPYTIDDYNPNDAEDPASGQTTAYISTATNPPSGLSRWDFKHQHYVGDKLYFENPGQISNQDWCSNPAEICACLERNEYCRKVLHNDCNDRMRNLQECDKHADSCWMSASDGCKQACVNAQWSRRDQYAKKCGCSDRDYAYFYHFLESADAVLDARTNASDNSSTKNSGGQMEETLSGKRTC